MSLFEEMSDRLSCRRTYEPEGGSAPFCLTSRFPREFGRHHRGEESAQKLEKSKKPPYRRNSRG